MKRIGKNASRAPRAQAPDHQRNGGTLALLRRTLSRVSRSRAVGALLLAAALSSCVTTPVTGRRAFNVFGLADDVQLGTQAYAEIKADPRVQTSGPDYQMVSRIMTRLATAAAKDDPGFEWEVVVIDDPQMVNAFALPGGKMAVYTGIIPVAQTEDGLAVVMGHEIAHAIARHGTERMTRAYGAEVAMQALGAATGGDAEATANLVGGLLNLTFNLPHGRSQESEADHIGLMYMAAAGYDPREAVGFWARMAQMSGGGGPPEFLSTHPSHETRISDLEKLMPEALAVYEGRKSP